MKNEILKHFCNRLCHLNAIEINQPQVLSLAFLICDLDRSASKLKRYLTNEGIRVNKYHNETDVMYGNVSLDNNISIIITPKGFEVDDNDLQFIFVDNYNDMLKLVRELLAGKVTAVSL